MLLKRKLVLTFLLIALIPTLTVGLIASYAASSIIKAEVFAKLVAVRDTRKAQLENYFSEREGDIVMLSRTMEHMLDSSSSNSLSRTADDNHLFFSEFIKVYGYYDLFVIDNSGQVVYSVGKENDYRTNLRTGPYNGSGLGRLYEQVTNNNSFAMVDFSNYAPSNGQPAAFVALPLKSRDGGSVVIALQLSIEKIDHIMQQRSGMGQTGESYLVGQDLLMRSDSFLDPKGHSIFASFAGDVENNGVDTEAANLAIDGHEGNREIIDYNGNPVLSAFVPVDIYGTRWAVISEIDVAEAFAPTYELYWNILIIVVIAVFGIISAALFVSRSILKPLGGEPAEMQSISETIAGGDLTVVFEERLNAESVYGTLQKMAKQLRTVMGEIVQDSQNLASVAEETSAASLQSTTSLQEQQASIEQVATAVEQMSSSIHEVSKNAASVASASQAVQSSSNEAHKSLSQTIGDLGALDKEIIQASDVIRELEKDSYEIGSVLEVIRGIADQTNLLALNAAIEAARAGEQGRGFAVVADEVRSLASKTQESTKSIDTMIAKLQGVSNKAVKVMTFSRDVCEKTVLNANTAAQVISNMNVEVDNITQLTEIIATAVEEQSRVSVDISQSVTVINDVAHENAVSAEQVSAASHEISHIANTLRQITSRFKVAH